MREGLGAKKDALRQIEYGEMINVKTSPTLGKIRGSQAHLAKSLNLKTPTYAPAATHGRARPPGARFLPSARMACSASEAKSKR
jgi:hypothetical protein